MIQKIIKIINKTIIYSIQTLIYISKSLSDNLDKSFLISLILFYFMFFFNSYLKCIKLYLNIIHNRQNFIQKVKHKIKLMKLSKILCGLIFLLIFQKLNFKIYFIPVLGTIFFIIYMILQKYSNPQDSFEYLFSKELLDVVKKNSKLLDDIKKYAN